MSKRQKSRTDRPTFRQILEEAREKSAERLWKRAQDVSRLRHLVITTRRGRATAVALADAKARLIRRAMELGPDKVSVGIDSDFHVGLLSVRWKGLGRLHLPASTELPCQRHQANGPVAA